MRSHLPWHARPVFLLLLTLSAVPVVFAGDAQWIEVKSPHFSVVTDAGEKRGRETAMRFEQMRAVFDVLMTRRSVNIPVPLQIVAFRNSREMQPVCAFVERKAGAAVGICFWAPKTAASSCWTCRVENPWSVVFHEYAHQLMNGVLTARVDPWFEEGFAEYFSSIEVDSKEARVGKIPEDEYRVLQQNGMMKVADLFRVQQNSSTYNESGSHRTVFYAQSGMVVHYLYDNNLIPRLTQYFDLKLARNVPVESAIQQSLGMSAADFDKALRNYVSSGHFQVLSNAEACEHRQQRICGAASQSGGQRRRARRYSSALAAITASRPSQSSRKFSKPIPTTRRLAVVWAMPTCKSRTFTQAAEYFKRAAQADSKDPRVHYYTALLMSREGVSRTRRICRK